MTAAEYEAVLAAYDANSDYDDGAGDVTKARAFKVACRKLLRMPTLVNRFATGGANIVEHDPKFVNQQLVAVTSWLVVNDSANTSDEPVQLSFEELRS